MKPDIKELIAIIVFFLMYALMGAVILIYFIRVIRPVKKEMKEHSSKEFEKDHRL